MVCLMRAGWWIGWLAAALNAAHSLRRVIYKHGKLTNDPVVLAILYKTIEDGAIVTDAALVANISRHAYYDLI